MVERGDLTEVQNCIKSGYKGDESEVLIMADDTIQGSGQKLRFGRFRLDIRKNFTQRVVQHWSRLSRCSFHLWRFL